MDKREAARKLFGDSFGYGDIDASDIAALKRMLSRSFSLANASAESEESVAGSIRVDWGNCSESYDDDGRLVSAYIKCKASYFDKREAVSFNPDGFIGFCGWADSKNEVPIIETFERWVTQWLGGDMRMKGSKRTMMTRYPLINVKLDDGAYLPERAHDTDAGADIRCREGFTLKAHGFASIDTGVHIELPPTTKCEVKSKSGLWVNHGIITTGLIDEGFSGTIRVGLANLSDEDYTFEAGEMVTQLCVSPVCYPTYVEASEVVGGERGDAGYGSTGRGFERL